MHWPRALRVALASITIHSHAASTSAFEGSGSGSTGENQTDIVLPTCNTTALFQPSENSWDCSHATNFSFSTVATRLSSENASRICALPSCRQVYDAVLANVYNTDDCVLEYSQHLRLYADVLDPLAPFCNASRAYNNGSDVGSPAVEVPSDRVYSTIGPSTLSEPTVATIVSSAVGALLAFVVVVIAVVWYKRQSLRDLRHHAYVDPLVDVKPQLASGVFNANFARRFRTRGGKSSTGSSSSLTLSATGEQAFSNAINLQPLRPLQQTFHGDTLWNDQELLARHMRTEDIEDIRVIGNGGHGVVYLVLYRGSRLLASKRLVQDHITRDKTRLLIAEIKLVAKLEHPCIVQFVGAAWTTELDLQALFEYMPNGDLCTYLDKTSEPNESETWDLPKLQIAMDIAEALVYVHSFAPPLVHRDLKSRNVLLDENRRAKLTDFGVSRFHSNNNTMTTGIGTSRWLAPEVMAGGGAYDETCDIYSLGIVISELDTHRLPFAGLRMPSGNSMPEMSILQLVSQGALQPRFRATCPESLQAIALRCVAFEPTARPSAIEVSYVLRTIAKNEFGL